MRVLFQLMYGCPFDVMGGVFSTFCFPYLLVTGWIRFTFLLLLVWMVRLRNVKPCRTETCQYVLLPHPSPTYIQPLMHVDVGCDVSGGF